LTAVADNDIILKAVCYDAFDEFLGEYSAETPIGMLGAARYVVRKRISKLGLTAGATAAFERLNVLLQSASVVEPSSVESLWAAELEIRAQQQGVSLDSGESQLCAVVVSRIIPWLLTGDKRAIRGLQHLLAFDDRLSGLKKRVVCLEQLALIVQARGGERELRSKICAEPGVDKSLSICFSCSNSESTASAGLQSYIAALRAEAADILAD
jgi:hypothetical protein